MIRRRDPGESIAYVAGYKAGWEAVMHGLRQGKTPGEVQQQCELVQGILDGMTSQTAAERFASARAQEPRPSQEQ